MKTPSLSGLIVAMCTIAVCAGSASGRTIGEVTGLDPEAGQPIALGIWADPVARDTLTMGVVGSCRSSGYAIDEFRITIPSGLELVSGDTAFTDTIRMMRAARPLRVTGTRAGAYEVRALLRLRGSAGWEELQEAGLPIRFEAGALRAQPVVYHRGESIRGGHRFRYSLWCLLPLDSTDVFDAAEFAARGQRAKLVGERGARCPTCGLAAPDMVNFMAVIDKHGRVMQASARGRPDRRVQSREVVDAARSTLAEWKFRPAKLSSRPVYDWCWVSVPVR